ncbi:hypothetical protein CCACVL1_02265 [Corchorus capsularis]|uniref:Uncharacterized protein n=1 Tax=Corchorus capsularis TaxID=210143 RepID=A0A1R3K4P0_COCAP|nr:hypothetical protein CCACVL1_02930 [Corchorus capsularis]OMP03793.1 hypothetical protein CCACVL1_02265 [Corchorus capsularis]
MAVEDKRVSSRQRKHPSHTTRARELLAHRLKGRDGSRIDKKASNRRTYYMIFFFECPVPRRRTT